jgi:hypothetical protein
MMGWIVLRLMDFDEGLINKSNATLKLWKLCHQNPLLLNTGPISLIDNGKIDVRCNKYAIVIYWVLAPISHESIIINHSIMFHEQNQNKQTFFWANLDGRPKVWCGSLVDLT